MNTKLRKRLTNREPLIWSWMLCISEKEQKTPAGALCVFEIQKEKKIYGGVSEKQKQRQYIYKEERT